MNQLQVEPEARYEFIKDYIKTILNLATGAMVLTITFLHEILGFGTHDMVHTVQARDWLLAAWLAFLGCIIGAVAYLHTLGLHLRGESHTRGFLVVFNVLTVLGFFAGLAFFCWFGLKNLP